MLSKVSPKEVTDICNQIIEEQESNSEEYSLEMRLELAENILNTIASGDENPWLLCQIYINKNYPGKSSPVFVPNYIDKEHELY